MPVRQSSAVVTVFGLIGFFSACVASGTSGGAGGSTPRADPTITVGDMVTLLPEGAFGLGYFPDEGVSILSFSPFQMLIADGLSKSTFLLEATGSGDPLRNLTGVHRAFGPGPAGTFDNGYAGASAVYRHTDGVYYAFYHAEDQEGTGVIPGTNIPGFYARIGIAYSNDAVIWNKGGYVIESFVPKRTADGGAVQFDQGAAEPGVAVSPDGRYLYLYYSEHSRLNGAGGSRPVVICMARTELASWPPAFPSPPGPLLGVFTKYRDGTFSSDGIGGIDSPVVTPPVPSSNALEGHLTYSPTYRKFVMIFGVDAWTERIAPAEAVVSGLYYALSDDGVDWRPSRVPLVRDFGVAQPHLSVSWEGTILWDQDSDNDGWMAYGYTPDFGDPGHFLVGRRISLSEGTQR